MIARGFVLLEIVSIIALPINGQPNPFFECHTPNMEDGSYTVTINEHDEIVINNCTSSLVDGIIKRLSRTTLRRRPLRLQVADATTLQEVAALQGLVDLDLSANNLTEVDVRKFDRLKVLNLTSNRIRRLQSIKLSNTTLDSLDVSRNRLFKFEHWYVPPTRRLYVHSNNIFELGPNVTLPRTLELLDLTRNEIENVEHVRFRSKSLKVLNLSVNLINSVPEPIFRQLPALETLVLECNKIFDIEVGAFSGNAKLIELNLRDNNLSALKKGVFDDLVNLQALDISKNELLKVTPDAVQNLNNLIDFSVSENAKLCDDECKHDMEFLLVLGGRLRALKMERLRLRQFPVTLTTSIRRLDLSNNELRTVQLGNLENFPFLQELTLSGNDVETTENDVFSRMEFLQKLYLDNNRLRRVPKALPQYLDTLHLHRNRIVRIERNDLNGLVNLKTLTLNSNLIHSVESESFRSLENLEILDISDNPIVTLSTDTFEGPVKLKFLFASELKDVVVNATDLRYFPVSEMPNLRTLNLSRSPEMVKSFLQDMPLLATVKQLEVLDISLAHLIRIPTYLEDFLPRLKYLRSMGNPLDCKDSWWRKWKRSNRIEIRELRDDHYEPTVRISPRAMKPIGDRYIFVESSCSMPVAGFTTVSSQQFWMNEKRSSNATSTTALLQSTPTANPTTNSSQQLRTNQKISNVTTATEFLHQQPKLAAKNTTISSQQHWKSRKNFSSAASTKTSVRHQSVSAANSTSGQHFWTSQKGSSEAVSTMLLLRRQPFHAASVSTIARSRPKETRDLRSTTAPVHTDSHKSTSEFDLSFINTSRSLNSEIPQSDTSNLTLSTNRLLSTITEQKQNQGIVSSSTTLINNSKSPSTSRSTTSTFAPQQSRKFFPTMNIRTMSHSTSVISQLPLPSTSTTPTATSKPSSLFSPPSPLNSTKSTSLPPPITSSPSVFTPYFQHLSQQTAVESNQSRTSNQTDNRISFTDWFPSFNETTNLAEQTAGSDEVMEYTHPGLIIFSAITCWLMVVSLILLGRTYLQKYKWPTYRYQITEFDNEFQRSMEINSVSGFMETELSFE